MNAVFWMCLQLYTVQGGLVTNESRAGVGALQVVPLACHSSRFGPDLATKCP
jgi:hypothetical protein